jgi:hypothetical protein
LEFKGRPFVLGPLDEVPNSDLLGLEAFIEGPPEFLDVLADFDLLVLDPFLLRLERKSSRSGIAVPIWPV